jgi:predicted phage replisome organizer
MNNNSRYYWLKLKRDFFKRHDIRIIERMPNGKDYLLFYLKLLCESVDHDGNLRFSDQIPYNEDMLATITDTNVDIVRSAIKVFTELNMMELMDDGTYFLNEVQKMIGSASQDEQTRESGRLRVQAYRERKKQQAIEAKRYSNVTCNGEKDIEKEKDIDINKQGRFTPPTVEEIRLYCQGRKNNVNPEQFYTYYAENNWHLSNGKKMKSWKASVITWEQNHQRAAATTKFASYPQREESSGDNLKGFRISKTNVTPEEIRERLKKH